MACNSSTCQSNSGCYKREEEPISSKSSDSNQQSTCVKCKVNEPVSGTSDDGRFCRECFRSNLYGEFKLAGTSKFKRLQVSIPLGGHLSWISYKFRDSDYKVVGFEDL
ncbi:hypothetical protein Ddye_009112 [Dipteronia dyeriana]|uniref:Uncharacterized protein n=1 Tax=Dipteronia dyeriana TaxID=168575 RepID=A0AAD9XB14_9ROSI|nr:hypothetical protein Ddye_009112 [Dipteronia dyeriana]